MSFFLLVVLAFCQCRECPMRHGCGGRVYPLEWCKRRNLSWEIVPIQPIRGRIIQPQGRRHHACTVVNDRMYVYGGMYSDGKVAEATLWRFVIDERFWEEVDFEYRDPADPSAAPPRLFGHSMTSAFDVPVKDELYVYGGFTVSGEDGSEVIVESSELYRLSGFSKEKQERIRLDRIIPSDGSVVPRGGWHVANWNESWTQSPGLNVFGWTDPSGSRIVMYQWKSSVGQWMMHMWKPWAGDDKIILEDSTLVGAAVGLGGWACRYLIGGRRHTSEALDIVEDEQESTRIYCIQMFNKWLLEDVTLPEERRFLTSSTIDNQYLFLVGGENDNDGILSTTVVMDQFESLESVKNLPVVGGEEALGGRAGHCAVVSNDVTIYVFGGSETADNADVVKLRTELEEGEEDVEPVDLCESFVPV